MVRGRTEEGGVAESAAKTVTRDVRLRAHAQDDLSLSQAVRPQAAPLLHVEVRKEVVSKQRDRLTVGNPRCHLDIHHRELVPRVRLPGDPAIPLQTPVRGHCCSRGLPRPPSTSRTTMAASTARSAA